MSLENAAPARDDDLCFHCGLCCDGTLYSHVALQEGDSENELAARGLVPSREEGGIIFRLPCAAYRERRCAIYAARPDVCRRYRCAVLREHEAGRLAREAALSLVREALALRDRVLGPLREFVGAGAPASFPELLEAMTEKFERLDAAGRGRVEPRLLLDVGALRIFLSRRYEPLATRLGKAAEADDRAWGEPGRPWPLPPGAPGQAR